MEQYKRAKVIILPTENKQNAIWLDNSGYLLYNQFLIKQKAEGSFQHLYIISDEEIKEGDWCYDKSNYHIVKYSHKVVSLYFVQKPNNLKQGEGYSTEKENLKKIIATTDTSLKYQYSENHPFDLICLPQPSQQFIEKYIESYNKGEIITDVLVEYEKDSISCTNECECDDENECFEVDYQLKVNPKDNTITIKKLKDSWNREELIDILKISHQGHSNKIRFGKNNSPFDINEWIKENL